MVGGQAAKQRAMVKEQLAAIPESEERLIVATGRYIGEGFDDPRLDALFLVMPISWHGALAQYAGRLHPPPNPAPKWATRSRLNRTSCNKSLIQYSSRY